mmetsp:Transcript_98532/g.195452  ORF Transcript_98532/g.195452 Transcript_98532/m.195452 type:complete len:152 (-) Transcript_98532:315-770(-)
MQPCNRHNQDFLAGLLKGRHQLPTCRGSCIRRLAMRRPMLCRNLGHRNHGEWNYQLGTAPKQSVVEGHESLASSKIPTLHCVCRGLLQIAALIAASQKSTPPTLLCYHCCCRCCTFEAHATGIAALDEVKSCSNPKGLPVLSALQLEFASS